MATATLTILAVLSESLERIALLAKSMYESAVAAVVASSAPVSESSFSFWRAAMAHSRWWVDS